MYHSKINFLKLSSSLLLVVLLASCSSMPGSDKPLESQTDLAEEQKALQEQSIEGENEASPNSLLAYQGEDPMGDIQINAEIKKAYQNVAKFNIEKKYQQALDLLDGLKVKYPQLSGPDYQKARIYFNQQKLEQALESVQLSLKNNERNYYALNLQGIIYREMGMFDEAKTVYLRAIEIYPPYPKSHLNLGVLADIYMRDSALALIQYQQYQALTNGNDKTVSNWILEIERRIKAGG